MERKKLYGQLKIFLKEIGKLVGLETEAAEIRDKFSNDSGFIDAARLVFNKIAEKNSANKNQTNYLEFARLMANTLENKDPYSYDHSGRVNYYANLIAQKFSAQKRHGRPSDCNITS